ncbi:hypothetical protein [Streptomyces pratensis]|uniref:hypothetical protein n=1 Tax=Streptomyces pratensis TaxID=1169025 RepID=UPI00362EFC78
MALVLPGLLQLAVWHERAGLPGAVLELPELLERGDHLAEDARVLACLDHVEQQRKQMLAEAFALAHDRTRQRILTQVLPAFPNAVITEAPAIAEAARPLENLPPWLRGIGSRQ